MLFIVISLTFSYREVLVYSSNTEINSYETTIEDGDYLITRVVDVEFPMSNSTHSSNQDDVTIFETMFTVEIENPTNSNIECVWYGSPFPFPLLEYWTENESLTVEPGVVIEWPIGTYVYEANTTQIMQHPFAFIIKSYNSTILPIGWYSTWWDFVYICSVPVPVITYGMIIYSFENKIEYVYEYNNSTEIYTYTTTDNPSSTALDIASSLLYSAFTFLVIFLPALIRRRKVKIDNKSK